MRAKGSDEWGSDGSPEPCDTGDRVRHVRFEVSPTTMLALVLVVASLWLLIRLWPVFVVLVAALVVVGTLRHS